MEDSRRLHYEARPHYTRYPAAPRRKHKDAKRATNHAKDKYGSVSAQSTSAIYGALRAPQYHAVYGPSNIWYASVRSLNRAGPVMYPPEGYVWRDTLYEDAATKEVYALAPPPPVELVPCGPVCGCRVRCHDIKSRHHPAPDYRHNGKKPSLITDKLKTPIMENEILDTKPDSTASRMSGYKKVNTKFRNVLLKGFSTKSSKKSILECDVNAYDLLHKVPHTQSISEIEDSDQDDNLNDNAVAKVTKSWWLNFNKSSSPRQRKNPDFKKAQSENCIYSESHSVMVGGQRIFTRSKSPDLGKYPLDESNAPRWRKMCFSDESICIPAPDYDYSDDSDDGTVITKYRDPKFTYSPPASRKATPPGDGIASRELSKSMSSLLSEDNYISSINVKRSGNIPEQIVENFCDNSEDVKTTLENGLESTHPKVRTSKTLSESSSDTSSSGGTLSSEYPTWTSSSSNELKSILKKKKKRDNLSHCDKVFQTTKDLKDLHRNKKVQFQPACTTTIINDDSVNELDTKADPGVDQPSGLSVINGQPVLEDGNDATLEESHLLSGAEIFPTPDVPKRSNSFEEVRKSEAAAGGRRRSTLPKRRVSDLQRLLGGEENADCTTELNFAKKQERTSLSESLFDETTQVPNQPAKDGNNMDPPELASSSEEKAKQNDDKKDCDFEEAISPEQYDTDEDFLENEYDTFLDPIYEELSDVSNSFKLLQSKQKSFFEGASKIDILSYLEDAKERSLEILEEETIIEKPRLNQSILSPKEVLLKIEEDVEKEETENSEENDKGSRISEVERNDSGVGTETSKPRVVAASGNWEEQLCADCDHPVQDEDLVCKKCDIRRGERKETIFEFVDTELKYGRDLNIIKEEFYRPMEIAGLLAKDQLHSIFLNLDELISANTKFSEKLQDALDIATEHGDEDYTTVSLGKIFLDSSSMLHAYETYCVKQAPASVLLSSLEKEKELLRIFLRVSQMENTLLRRMNLPAFLMVPVQRVTRYPLLLCRLHKVTPIHHKDRSALKEAQQKVELHLEHINQQTKNVGGTKIWRRISNISTSHRRLGKDIGSIKLRKMALEILDWKQDETRFVMAGKLLFTQITDYPWNKKGKTVKFSPVHALLIALGKPNSNYRPESSTGDAILFPRNTGIRDASLVLMKEKNGRFVIVREPLYLGNCVISCDSDTEEVFEVQEYTSKEAYIIKGEAKNETKEWLSQLRYHAKDLGSWRKRRNALANIMINGMVRQ